MENEIKFSRVWAMPNANTFQFKPIKEMVEKYVKGRKVIIDPFANESKYGTITNDLNTKFDTDYHLDALDFLRKMKSSSADMVLFDPPFSVTQAAFCYKSMGLDKLTRKVTNCKYWSDVKKEIGRICKVGELCFPADGIPPEIS